MTAKKVTKPPDPKRCPRCESEDVSFVEEVPVASLTTLSSFSIKTHPVKTYRCNNCQTRF